MLKRRSFLQLGASAAVLPALNLKAALNPPFINSAFSQQPKPKLNRLKLSVTWGMMNRLPIPDGLAKLKDLGYDAYEMFNWRDPKVLDTFLTEAPKYPNLACATLISNKGVTAQDCGLVNPKERDQFLKEMETAIEVAKKFNCKRLVTLTGNEVPGMSRDAMFDSAVAGLKAIAPTLEKNGITAVIEVLNTYVDHRGYYLYYVRDGAKLIDAVGSPNVKILFDIYHVQIMEGNLIPLIRQNIQRIDHFHIGDHPGRHQPGTGEINYRNVFKAIHDLGYEGYAALEYGPTIPLYLDLINQRNLTIFE
ncbi:MAG: TIM barrel protein [Acidobacteria bacterium]|nr:TIM barrel protein [Acidobacteriota bacterium]MBI3421832.1 TIM barrel protein [Acidobacteriota bacterium]